MKISKIKSRINLSYWFIKTFVLLILVSTITITGCQKNEIPELPENPTELDFLFTRFLYAMAPQEQDMPIYELLDLELLQALYFSTPDHYLEDLIGAIEHAESIGNPIAVYLGLKPASEITSNGSHRFIFDQVIAPRLTRYFAPFPEQGMYVLENILVATTTGEQNLIDLQSTDVEEVAKAAEKGGICATLAVAHSLIRNLGIIPTDGRGNWPAVKKTIDGKEYWDPDFLKKVYAASGDNDGKRGLTPDQYDDAHKADWNGNWLVRRSKNMTNIMKPGDNPSAAELRAWCRDLKKYFDDRKDDCLLRARGTLTYKDKDGITRTRRVGHLMTISKVVETNGKCVVTVVNTAKQDPKKNWEKVPFNPAEQEWEISPTGTKITKNNGWGNSIVWDEVYTVCYDEEPRRADVKSTDLGEPGEAIK